MRIAIIGSGIAGLAAAWRLHRVHDITLFEAQDRLGGHAHTVDVQVGGHPYAVDTGFIVYNDRTYPHFIGLLDELGLAGRDTQMSFSVSCERSGHEYASHSLNGLFASRRALLSPAHLRMLAEILRFNRIGRTQLAQAGPMSLGDFAATMGFSARFTRFYLYPMCAAIWSSSLAEAADFPAGHFLRFFDNHGLLSVSDQPQWKTLPGGSRRYVEAIGTRLGHRVRLNSPVLAVSRRGGRVQVDSPAGREVYDEIILACHSDQALDLLSDASPREREVLGALPFSENEAVLHTDRSLLPRRRQAWASWNYRIGRDDSRPAALTYDMNLLQHLNCPQAVCVSLNQSERIAPRHALGSYRYAHPVYTVSANAARARRFEISGQRHTHFCGAYWYNGFHEDGVRSALDVVDALQAPALAA